MCSSDLAAQHEIIDGFLEAERLLPGGDGEAMGPLGAPTEAKEQPGEEALILKICTLSNVVLLFMKAGLAVRTGSLSLMTAALDSLLDILSGGILLVTSLSASSADWYRFPIGKQRMEPVGIIVFSSVMGTFSLSVLFEAVRQLIRPEPRQGGAGDDLPVTVGVMAAVILFKAGLYVYCRRSPSPAVAKIGRAHV
mgnify:CR=1 FL=1